ncbi:hypothetical protein D3C87_1314190 [compost metagenome]
MMVCRGRCVDFSAQVLGNLHGHAAHATGRGMDQHLLATLHASVLGQRLPGRQGRCGDSTGLQGTEGFWFERQLGNLGNRFGRITTDDVDEAEHFITDVELSDALAQRDDGAGHFDARGKRQRQRDERLHGAGQDLPVNRVHAGPGHIDQHFTNTGDWVCDLFQT